MTLLNNQRPFKISKPLIAGVLNDTDVRTFDSERLNAVDIIELRYDLFHNRQRDEILNITQQAKSKFNKPLLATIRHPSEGGSYEIHSRVDLYKELAPVVEMIDIEIAAAEEFRRVQSFCAAAKTILIGSYHKLSLTPDLETLEVIHATGRTLGADIIKLALTPNSREDVLRILDFTIRHHTENIIAIAMGEIGIASRVFAPLLGSLVTYGSIMRTSAPGQLSVQELSDLMVRLRIR
jgi:3-dehydroquinate dehydratase-1